MKRKNVDFNFYKGLSKKKSLYKQESALRDQYKAKIVIA